MEREHDSEDVFGRSNAVARIEHLGRALRQVGDALVALDANDMLSAESSLSAAMAALHSVPETTDRAALTVACRQVQTELLRCRRLGASFSKVARAFARRGAAVDGYDRAGGYYDGVTARPSLRTSI